MGDRFLDDVLDGPEGEGNLGWYRRVQLNDMDQDEDIYYDDIKPTVTTKTTYSDSKQPSSTATKTTTTTTRSINYKDKSNNHEPDETKIRDLSNENRDLHDELHNLKIELTKRNAEKDSLEEELLSCYEQKENLRILVNTLRGGKSSNDDSSTDNNKNDAVEDLLQIHRSDTKQQQEERVKYIQQEQNKLFQLQQKLKEVQNN